MKKTLFTAGLILTTALSASAQYRTISPEEAKKQIDSGKKIILLDVRTPEEYAQGHIAKSVLLPVDRIDEAQSVIKDKNAVIFVYCRSGRRSRIAAEKLIEAGYKNVFDLGGISSWPYGTVK